jgi:hypothetical protein
VACDIPGIPDRLHKGEREADDDFSDDTKIFIRIDPKYFLTESETEGDARTFVSQIAFRTSLQSCNRDKYSEQNDVLFNINAASKGEHYPNWGVISISKDLLFDETFDHPSLALQFKLDLIHSVEECMYPHSEITIYEVSDNEKNNIELSSKTLKTEIKSFYTDNLVIEKTPD